MKSHPFQKMYSKHPAAIYIHAEVDAIKNAVNQRIEPEIISKSTLFVARQKIIDKKWTSGLARPCCGCQRCVSAFDIKQVVYSLDNHGYAVFE